MDYSVEIRLDSKKIAKTNPLAYKYEDYNWWVETLNYFVDKADSFEMRLWKEDLESIESAEKQGQKEENTKTDELVYKGHVGESFKKEVLENYLNKDGYIKWFSLNLWKNGELILSSEHYGSHLHVYVKEKDLIALRRIRKRNPIILGLDILDMDNFLDD